MSLTISDEMLHAAKVSEQELKRDIAVMLYEAGRLSTGKAAELAEMGYADFQHLLANRGVPSNYDASDLEQDLRNIRKLRRA
jgi:predicted HTH domain antitoxin